MIENKKRKLKCGSYMIHQKLKKKKISAKSIPSQLIKKINIPTNPYCSSITGKYVFDISKIPSFKIYFWTESDNPSANMAIEDVINMDNTEAINWSSFFKNQTKKAIDSWANLFGKTTKIVNNYSECDWVCVLVKNGEYLGLCYGPEFLYTDSAYVDGKVVYVISYNEGYAEQLTDANMTEGGFNYITLIHEAGHGFGLAHPHDDGFGSTIMPGIIPGATDAYKAISGFSENSIFMTVMSYNDEKFFLPSNPNYKSNGVGYPFSLMPLDISALKWMYKISNVNKNYADKYGVKLINPIPSINNQAQTIMGKNRTITFGNNCWYIAFYFTANTFDYKNLNPIKYTYNRILGREYSFYPMDTDASISTLVLNNIKIANIFCEPLGIRDNVKIVVNCNICNIYINNDKNAYNVCKDSITEKSTGKTATIIKNKYSKVNIYFNS